MNDDLKPGDPVKYRVGRGYGLGKVANVSAGMVLINTPKGKSLKRKLSEVQADRPEAAPAVEEAAN